MSALAGLSILVVEDEFMIALDAEDMLRGAGAERVEIVGTYDNARRLAETGRFDVAILDVNLNGHMSFPIGEILKRKGTPVVYASGYDLADRPIAGFEGGICVGKPYTAERLERALIQALEKARAAQSV